MGDITALDGRLALVTGASGGLGSALALALVRAGADVALHYGATRGPAEALATRVRDLGRRAETFQADLSADDGARELVASVAATMGDVDILVNNAATTAFVPWDDLDAASDEVWRRVLQVNLMAPVALTRAVLPGMTARAWGRVLNVASTSGVGPTGSSLPYAVSKSALIALTQNLASVAPAGVSVCAVAPGWMDTGWSKRFQADGAPDPHGSAESVVPEVAVEEVARVAVQLVHGTGANGSVIVLDSGTGLRHAHLAP